MVADAEHEQQRDKENDERDQLAEELRDHGLAPLFDIKIPEIAIDERDHDPGAEEGERGADVVAVAQVDPVNPERGVESQSEREELEDHSKANAGPALQQSADRKA